MKTLTPILALAGPIAGVVAPASASAGFSISFALIALVVVTLAAVAGYAWFRASSVDQVRTGSSSATNYFAANPAVAWKTVPAAKRPAAVPGAARPTRRVSAIVEIAA